MLTQTAQPHANHGGVSSTPDAKPNPLSQISRNQPYAPPKIPARSALPKNRQYRDAVSRLLGGRISLATADTTNPPITTAAEQTTIVR